MGFVYINLFHVDGINKVKAKGLISNCVFKGEYKYKGMTYGVEFETEHDIIPILGYENDYVGEQCRQCGKEIYLYKNVQTNSNKIK